MRSMVMQRPLAGGLFTAVLLAATAAADVPRLIQFQGKLVGSNGAAMPGPVDLRFRLYADAVNPTPLLFDETHSDVMLTRGLFSILVGSNTGGGIPDSAVAAPTVYIGVTVDTGPELAPRRQIVTAPYTFKARSAELLVKPGTLDAAVSVDPQGRVAVGAGNPSDSAALEVASTTGGFLPPRMTTAQRDAIGSPDEGLMVFNADTGCLNMRMNGVWRVFGAPETPGAITGPTDVCSGSTGVAYSVGDVPGAVSFQWEVPPGSTVTSGQGTAFPTVDFGPLTGSISVKAVNGCGTSAANTLSIVVSGSPPATPSEIAGPLFPIEGSDTEYSAPAVFGATSYTWTVPSGWTLVSGQGNNSITATIGATGGDLTVTANNACGSSSPRTLSITAVPVTNLTSSPTTLGYTGAMQGVRVPAGVTSMTVETWGAQGGNGSDGPGGQGARMKGTFAVAPGQVLKVLVGQQPAQSGSEGGGGGGTFVTDANDSPLIVAGGGGGTSTGGNRGSGGTTATDGLPGNSGSAGPGGTNGEGGGNAPGSAAGGGGFIGSGANSGWSGGASKGGESFLNGGAGGLSASSSHGGFGGGGSAHSSHIGGGGAGGYSGGGGGISGGGGGNNTNCCGGGGGGSFNSGSNPSNASAVQSGNGQVTFTW